MNPIAIFYHCLFFLDSPDNLLASAVKIVNEQWNLAKMMGLVDAATEIHVGLNGGLESLIVASMVIPRKAHIEAHGLKCHSENRTILMLEKWLPNHKDWYVLYFHAKGCTHPEGDAYGDTISAPWRRTMNHHLVVNWRTCVADLDAGVESVGCHFMRGLCDGSQNIWGGNFWWAKASFLSTLPSICLRERIKTSGLDAAESRYEAEVWIGNGNRVPTVKEYLPQGGGGIP